jgi:hypothetical protein
MNGQALDEVTRDWGASWDITTDMAIKLMPGAHPFHAIAEAAIEAASAGNVDPRQVEQIVISAIQMRDWGGGQAPARPGQRRAQRDLLRRRRRTVTAARCLSACARGKSSLIPARRRAARVRGASNGRTWMRSIAAWCRARVWPLRGSTPAST